MKIGVGSLVESESAFKGVGKVVSISSENKSAIVGRSRFARRFLEPHMSRNFFLGGELVGAEEAASEIDDEMSGMMTASTGS